MTKLKYLKSESHVEPSIDFSYNIMSFTLNLVEDL